MVLNVYSMSWRRSRTFKTLRERESEIALYTLWQLHSNKEDREMNCILGYLAYWRGSNK